jgi:hypothetical protein
MGGLFLLFQTLSDTPPKKKKKKKKLRLYVSGKKLSMVAWACHPSLGRIHKIGGSQSRPAWAKNETLSPK